MNDPTTGITTESGWNFDDFILILPMRPCVVCREPTAWVELNFEAHVCPGPCDEAQWRAYWEACRR